jgi:uncharacterized protein YktB (UPF0637 family)
MIQQTETALAAPKREVFQVFAIDDFVGRMAAIRQTVRPWLENAGEVMTPALSDLVGEPIFAHVARHARRTVNPPEDTWVAFGPGKRGYKKERHFKIAISRRALRLLFEIGPEYADKSAWAETWRRRTRSLRSRLDGAGLGWFRNEHDEEPQVKLDSLAAVDFAALADHLLKGRDGQLVLGVSLPGSQLLRLKDDPFQQATLQMFRALLPCYHLDR